MARKANTNGTAATHLKVVRVVTIRVGPDDRPNGTSEAICKQQTDEDRQVAIDNAFDATRLGRATLGLFHSNFRLVSRVDHNTVDVLHVPKHTASQ
jgi:hypothetical protein